MNQADWIEELFAQLEDKPDDVEVEFTTEEGKQLCITDVSLQDNVLKVTLGEYV